MKKLAFYLFIILPFLASCNKDETAKPAVAVTDSVLMGAGYASDVYYSFANGVVKTQSRTDWDIAFSLSGRSASVLINGAAGVKLYQYPGDTTVWTSTLDTTGIAGWPALNNSDTSWYYSAFEANAASDFDIGWGLYNQLTHDVVGKAIFVIQRQNFGVKKIWIKNKTAATNSYTFVYANLDGTDSQEQTIHCADYANKNFVYYSIANNQLLDREPAKTDWDIVFTKYIDMSIVYPVTGALLNNNVSAQKVTDESISVDTYSGVFSTSISAIGSNWKEFNMDTYTYDIIPDTKYFVKTASGSVYKLYFTGFDYTVGKAVFETKKVK